MSDLDNVNSAFSVTVYKKLQKQISPLVEKLNQLEENTHLIETTPGPKGDKGVKGDQGIAGRDGERGLIGEQGIAGPQGKTGEQGLIGEQGLQGIQGDKGETGEQGIAGPQGVIGPQGIQGEKGDKGDTGQQGEIGDKGDTGQQGIQGNPGKDGLTGKTGPQGIQGLIGDTGIKGDTGEAGSDGKPGPQGIQGEAGPQGEAGIDGIDGNDGKDASLPDIDEIIKPHLTEVKKEIDSYVIKSDKDFNNWKSVINNHISNNAGGGVVKLRNLVDVQTSTAKVDGNFLKYDGSTDKWVGVDIAVGAPEQLNTLNELASALDDDENFATTVTNSIAAKAPLDSPNFTGNVGIGTTSPNELLHVEDSSSSSGTSITIQNAYGESPKNIKFRYNDNVETARIEGYGRNSTSLLPYLAFYVNQSTSSLASNDVAERMRINSTGEVGIGKTATTGVELDVNGDIEATGNISSNGIIKAFNTTQNVAQLEVGRTSTQYLEMKVSDPDILVTGIQDSDSNGNHHFVIDRIFAGTGANDFEIRKGGTAQLTVNTDGNVGIGTTSPTVALHVVGDLQVDDTDGSPTLTYDSSANELNTAGATFEINKSNGVDVAIGNDDFYVDMSTSRVGIGTRTPTQALDVAGNIVASGTISAQDLNINNYSDFNQAIFNGDVDFDGSSVFNGDVQFEENADFSNNATFGGGVEFQNDIQTQNIQVNGLIELDGGEGLDFTGGPGTINGAGDITSSGTVNAKGYSLNADTFTVVSTSSTLASSTNGLTVILQNTSPITITLPTRSAGHVTTFISETSNDVTFVGDTGVTVNSFGGANTTAGQFAQCQVIYKTSTIAFLGGNLV